MLGGGGLFIQRRCHGEVGCLMESGSFGAFVFGVFNRLLIVTGLHHILNNKAWFVFGSFTDPATGAVVKRCAPSLVST